MLQAQCLWSICEESSLPAFSTSCRPDHGSLDDAEGHLNEADAGIWRSCATLEGSGRQDVR